MHAHTSTIKIHRILQIRTNSYDTTTEGKFEQLSNVSLPASQQLSRLQIWEIDEQLLHITKL